jgi:hypothetical protein
LNIEKRNTRRRKMRKLRKRAKRKSMKFHFIYELISKVKGDISGDTVLFVIIRKYFIDK